ncbi:MAG: sulfur carrier protein ThiS [Phycisphaerae bacterium]
MTTCDATAKIKILLNGEPWAIQPPATLATLIADREPRPPFAVEVNKELVRRGDYETTSLHDGDTIEIVTLVGGG